MKKIVLVTGATSGFGEACAYKFAQNGYYLLINGRRLERLEALKTKLESEYGIKCHLLAFDIRDQHAVFEHINGLPEEWNNIDILINNAGLALGRDLFGEAEIEDWNTMIDTNVKGLLYVSKAVIPLMQKRKSGHVINMGSIAGKEVYERGNVYCASKYAVDAISQAMRIDLLKDNIKVTAIHPGAAETEFSLVRFKGDTEVINNIYKGFQPLSAEDVADIIFYTASLPPHVCINDLSVTCTQQANTYLFNKE